MYFLLFSQKTVIIYNNQDNFFEWFCKYYNKVFTYFTTCDAMLTSPLEITDFELGCFMDRSIWAKGIMGDVAIWSTELCLILQPLTIQSLLP